MNDAAYYRNYYRLRHPLIPKICKNCNGQFLPKQMAQKYCGMCPISHHHRRRIIPTHCAQCGNSLNGATNRTFCSVRCSILQRKAKNLAAGKTAIGRVRYQKESASCPVCSLTFEKTHPSNVYCSSKCSSKAARIKRNGDATPKERLRSNAKKLKARFGIDFTKDEVGIAILQAKRKVLDALNQLKQSRVEFCPVNFCKVCFKSIPCQRRQQSCSKLCRMEMNRRRFKEHYEERRIAKGCVRRNNTHRTLEQKREAAQERKRRFDKTPNGKAAKKRRRQRWAKSPTGKAARKRHDQKKRTMASAIKQLGAALAPIHAAFRRSTTQQLER